MKKKMTGLIYTGEHIEQLNALTRIRAVAALPMIGRYRMIDFPIASMIHSGIKSIGIVTQKNYHSLMDHLGSGREWDLHGKRGGMTILPPYMTSDNVGVYVGLLDALKSNMSFLRRSQERYIVVCDSGILFNVSFEKMLEAHVEKGADLTLLYSKERGVRRHGSGRYLDIDENGFVRQMESDPSLPHYENTYLSCFLIRRELLIDLVDRAVSGGLHHFSRELLAQMLREKRYRVLGYQCPGRVWVIDSISSYFNTNMDFLSSENRSIIFSRERPVWTKLRDEMPALYRPEASVSNSLIADGCLIEGRVENSILFRGVTVRPGAVVKNAIVMQDSVIQRQAQVENAILDKQVNVQENSRLISTPSYPLVVPKYMVI